MVETTIETTLVNKAEADGWYVRKVQWPMRRGAPDRLFAKGGRVLFMEIKDVDEPLRPLQVRERRRMADAGIEVHRVDKVRDGLRILGIT